MNSEKNRTGTQSSMGPVGFEPFYKVGPDTLDKKLFIDFYISFGNLLEIF
jgi:hypothetical protein